MDKLEKNKYEEELRTILESSRALDTGNAEDCLRGTGLGFYIPETNG